jgi:hypothetical protein
MATLCPAGLWERWHGEEGDVQSCTIVTTDANELMRPLHDRMPVILSPKHGLAVVMPAPRQQPRQQGTRLRQIRQAMVPGSDVRTAGPLGSAGHRRNGESTAELGGCQRNTAHQGGYGLPRLGGLARVQDGRCGRAAAIHGLTAAPRPPAPPFAKWDRRHCQQGATSLPFRRRRRGHRRLALPNKGSRRCAAQRGRVSVHSLPLWRRARRPRLLFPYGGRRYAAKAGELGRLFPRQHYGEGTIGEG